LGKVAADPDIYVAHLPFLVAAKVASGLNRTAPPSLWNVCSPATLDIIILRIAGGWYPAGLP
jgi:hypothetical protein